MTAAQLARARVVRRTGTPGLVTAAGEQVVLRAATRSDADAIHALILEHMAEGRLLPRERDEIVIRAERFVVAVYAGTIVGCAELAPLSRTVAEVRSLVVASPDRTTGIGQRLVDEIYVRAARAGFERLCAFTHAPGYFVNMGFSIVPHVWLPEKVMTDCHACKDFRRCGQYAVVRGVARARDSFVPLTSLHA